MKWKIIGISLVVALITLTMRSAPLGIMVPAYFSPGAKWNAMNYAASRVPLIAIMNPNSGPGSSQSSSYISALASLHAAGGTIIGYTHSSYGARAIADVEADIDTYISWYAVDGFFIDEMANDANTTNYNYYQTIYQYIKSKGAQYSVTGNPGVNTQQSYLSIPTVDCLMIFESDGSKYATYTPSSWVSGYTPNHFVHLPYNVAGVATMSNYLSLAVSRNAGWVYISDLTTYSALPTYWTNEVNLVQSLNGGSFPPTITDPTQPADRIVNIGDATIFQVSASGAVPLSYQWFFTNSTGTNAILNATNASYSIPLVQPGNVGSYFIQISNSEGVTYSRAASLTIRANTFKHITIDGSFDDWTNIPLMATKAQVVGDGVSFQNLYVANDENYLYLRFSLYSSANPFTSHQNIFFDTDTNAATGLSENGLGSEMLVQSGSAYRQTNGIFNAGTINGLNWQAAPAAPATEFEVRISRGVTYTNGATVFTSNTVAIFLESSETSGNKWLPDVAGGLLYTFATSPAVVFTDPTQPLDQYVMQGHAATFNVAATGAPVVQYQWYQGTNAISGATNASYAIAAAATTNAGSYYVAVSNPFGSTNSRNALLAVLLDTIPPAVTNITATARQVIITFSEPLTPSTATNLANYTLSGGVTVTNAVLTNQIVTLTTGSPLSLGAIYTLAINGVKDLFGNATHTTVSLSPTFTITIDGNISDWAGIAPIYSAPSGTDGAADFKDVYVYNDANYYYFRATLWHDIPSADGFFPKYCNLLYNTDNNASTGYTGTGSIGSEFLDQSGFFYSEIGGTFSGDGQVLVGMAAGYLIQPNAREVSFPADFEWRYPRNATFAVTNGGGLVFSTNVVKFIWQGQTPGFGAVLNTVPSGGGVLAYTNVVPTVVPSLPLGNLAMNNVPGGKTVLMWDPPGTLQYSSDLGSNSWTNLPAAKSPYVVPAGSGQLFFRLVQ